MTDSNFQILRERLEFELGSWDDDKECWVRRAPTNSELLVLLDALHCDQIGTRHPEVDNILRDRWLSS